MKFHRDYWIRAERLAGSARVLSEALHGLVVGHPEVEDAWRASEALSDGARGMSDALSEVCDARESEPRAESETAAAESKASPTGSPINDEALVMDHLSEIRKLAREVVEQGPGGIPDQRYSAYVLAANLVAHPDAAVLAHLAVFEEARWNLETCGEMEHPDAEILSLLKEFVEFGFGTHQFKNERWETIDGRPAQEIAPITGRSRQREG